MSKWIEDRIKEPHISECLSRCYYYPSLDEYWKEIMSKINGLIFMLKLEELKELDLV